MPGSGPPEGCAPVHGYLRAVGPLLLQEELLLELVVGVVLVPRLQELKPGDTKGGRGINRTAQAAEAARADGRCSVRRTASLLAGGGRPAHFTGEGDQDAGEPRPATQMDPQTPPRVLVLLAERHRTLCD